MAAARKLTMPNAISTIWGRGRFWGFYQGLVPWGWIEASTKGSVLLFATSELEYNLRVAGFSPGEAGILGGMGGGLAQAYSTMGFCTFMKTVEVTRSKGGDTVPRSSIQIAREIWSKEGFAGINKGVNAVAVRQMTNWGSRFGLSRMAEDLIRNYVNGNDPEKKNAALSSSQRILASAIGGGLSCWNQPIEVIRVEMQSQIKSPGRPDKLTIVSAAKWIYQNNGLKGFYRGVTPRIGLGIWQTVCMVFGGDYVKAYFNKTSK
jgi:hypothetical protein